MQGFALLFRVIIERIEASLADWGYDGDVIREEIEAAGIEAVTGQGQTALPRPTRPLLMQMAQSDRAPVQ